MTPLQYTYYWCCLQLSQQHVAVCINFLFRAKTEVNILQNGSKIMSNTTVAHLPPSRPSPPSFSLVAFFYVQFYYQAQIIANFVSCLRLWRRSCPYSLIRSTSDGLLKSACSGTTWQRGFGMSSLSLSSFRTNT